jgi:hypothetical protein
VQCGDINFHFAATASGSPELGPFGGHVCGHTAGSCPGNGQRFVLAEGPYGNPSIKVCIDVYTLVLSGARIQLPGSDKVVTLSSNFSSAVGAIGAAC